MPRELTYQMPLERLTRLGRSVNRKAYPTLSLLTRLIFPLNVALLMFLILNLDGLGRWLAGAGIPAGGELLFFGWCLIAVLAIWMLRRLRLRQITGRTDFNQMVQLKQDDGGLRFLTNGIEYYLTWGGISQMLLEHDGVVVSAGNLFFLVPDIAFAGPGDRLAFIREVYGHLSESARSLSERHVGAALKQARAA